MFFSKSPEPASTGPSLHPDSLQAHQDRSKFWALTIGCTGVVYGDIGTSPLYAFREAIHAATDGGAVTNEAVFGVLSLILWSLIVVVTMKYILFLLRMDNHGEGGILSLVSLAQKAGTKKPKMFIILAMLGAALFYGDAVITPAISVLSAVEGLKLVTPQFDNLVLPISICILIALFSVQRFGTHRVSALFGPITSIWFLTIGALGAINIVHNPDVFEAVNPIHAIEFVFDNPEIAFITLGAVFLAVTGAEALYADLGHFGRKPIQVAWLFLVFPCLMLNYMGQGALVLANHAAMENPFFLMAPEWLLLPLVILATIATIVASQAVITGAFSLTRQAIQHGMLPRLEIRHTSSDQEGQIYMPKINRYLLWVVVLICLIFGDSSSLAAAYGISVTGEMVITSLLAFYVFTKVWRKSAMLGLLIVVPFLVVECTFLISNMLKVFNGGVVALFIAGLLTLLMAIWVNGTRYLRVHAHRHAVHMNELPEYIERVNPVWIDGTAVYMTSDFHHVPMPLLQNLRHNKVMHKKNIILTVQTEPKPYVLPIDCLEAKQITPYMYMASLHFGYMQTPNVPQCLMRHAMQRNITADVKHATYFLGRRTIIPEAKKGLPLWQANIYDSMNHSAATATNFYHLPVDQVMELGQQYYL